MKTAAERDLAATIELMEQKSSEADEILNKADQESREASPEEQKQVTDLLTEVKNLRIKKEEFQSLADTQREIRELSGQKKEEVSGLANVEVVGKSETEVKSLGDQFIESKGYKDLVARGLNGEFTSGQIELDSKATLFTTVGSAVAPPVWTPGVVDTLFERNYLANLMPNIQTSGNQIRYVREVTATNAAAAVAEGQAKPQSTLIFDEVTENVKKIATALPVTDEMLEDAPQIRQYVNGRLALFVRNTEEAQLLLGAGTGANIAGIISAGRTIGTFARNAGTSNADAIFRAATGTRGSSFLNPDTVVLNPTNWQAIRLGTDANGQYYGGGPFYGPYGGPQGPAGANYFSVGEGLWGMNVLVTANMTVGSALLGAFADAAAVYRKSGINVEATNSHSTWFLDNITAIRAEERLALAVYRPSAFTVVTGLQ